MQCASGWPRPRSVTYDNAVTSSESLTTVGSVPAATAPGYARILDGRLSRAGVGQRPTGGHDVGMLTRRAVLRAAGAAATGLTSAAVVAGCTGDPDPMPA